MRKILLILIAITAVVPMYADNYIKYWDEGRLTWDDFKGEPTKLTTPTFFRGILEIKTDVSQEKVARFGKETNISTHAVAVMYKELSYADSAFRNDRLLRYHQLQFDMLEILRRKLQADLNAGIVNEPVEKRLKYYQDLYNEQLAELARFTVNGSNENRIKEEEYMVSKRLEEFKLPAQASSKPSKFSYGWYAGTGALIPTGEISNAFDFSWLFNFGITFGYDRVFLKGDISYGQPQLTNVRNELFGKDKEWATNKYTTQLSGIVTVGYRIVDTKSFAMTVNAGGGWTNYKWDVAEYKLNDKNPTGSPESEYKIIDGTMRQRKIHNFNYLFGLDFDWNFHTVVSDSPFFLSGRRERYTSTLRLSPYIMHQRYSNMIPQRDGFQIGIMLQYAGIARALGIK